MLVTPSPASLLGAFVEPREVGVPAMVLFCIHTVRLIFMSIPVVIVVAIFVVVLIAMGAMSAAPTNAAPQKRSMIIFI